ncbi:hypothetical protein BHE74_00007705 [Ensete ventricosum]|nr:hypothetical protein BHE74_00007705 [Ensete ventricosum]
MELQKVFCMNGGSGDLSYARNCTIQKMCCFDSTKPEFSLQSVIVSLTKAVRVDAVVEFYSTFFPDNMSIAELGCSSGPNALFSAFDMMEAVEQRCLQLRRSPPEFHLLLNDLPANDFNTIFRSLPEFYQQRRMIESSGGGQFFVSGVPGSFYGRLFPSRTLHFVHSSSSLHWLSQVPLEVQDKSKAPMNKGKIYLSKTSPTCVAEAYLMQFRRDFSLFLKCRAKEIVAGGHMVLTLMGRTRGSEPSSPEYSYMWELLGEALMDMASQVLVILLLSSYTISYHIFIYLLFRIKLQYPPIRPTCASPDVLPTLTFCDDFPSWSADWMQCFSQGIIEEEKVDSFNAPYFSPSLEEVKQEIEREGSFSIRTLDLFEASWDAVHGSRQTKQEAAAFGEITHAKRMAMGVRAVLESMLKTHFGEGIIMEELFSRYATLLEGYYSRNKAQVTNIVIALTRKFEEDNILRASVF